jgi:transposase InsO family protein
MWPQLQTLHEHLGWPYQRLSPALGLARSSVFRWAARLRRGEPAVRKPGPQKLVFANPAALEGAIATLSHGKHRSAGAPALWRSWQTMISRRDFQARVQEYRRAQQPQPRRVQWLQAAAVWAMDPGQQGTRYWNLVSDLGSRFRFELRVAPALPAIQIADHLVQLFERYGAPLVLKRDNGSNLVNATVDAVLDEFGVLPLTSPAYYPQYNGAIEYAQRELKQSVQQLTAVGVPEDEALLVAPTRLNHQRRPCLGSDTAYTVFYQARTMLHEAYSLTRRKEIKDSLIQRTESIVAVMKADTRRAHDAAWRQAVEEWLLACHIIAVAQPRPVLPQYP